MSDKQKRIIGFSLLLINLIIIKLFLGGKYLNDIGEELLFSIIIVFIASIVLMIIPLIIRLKNKKKLEYKKGKIICFLNSIIIFILFSIPNLLTILKNNNYTEYITIDPVSFSQKLILLNCIITIIYYFINKCFFVENNNK